MHSDVKDLLKSLNIEANSLELYELAFTHSSYNIDANTTHRDYEKLEFIGDSVVNFVIADLAFMLRKEMDQGDLSKLRAGIVQSNSLAEKAKTLNFAQYIKLGHSLPANTRYAKRILEDVFEAFVGALYLDKGILYAMDYVRSIFIDDVIKFDLNQIKDYKSELQEEMQAEHRESVKYSIVEEKGPAHDKTFVVKVTYNNIVLGVGEGKSKKDAEQNAARQALRKKAN